jgi:transposase
MALGQRSHQRQDELFIPTAHIAQSPGHPFYVKLNEVLSAAGFDTFVEELCAPYYKEGGRPGIPPGVYFRMLFVGYFEGIDSQRGIAWRCADSLALREFLGYSLTESTPVHASMTIIRKRLAPEVFQEVFRFVLGVLQEHCLLKGRTIGIDATTLEANAAMKPIVRRDTGEDWKEYLRKLAAAEGIENPTDEDLRRMDRKRPGKKVSNKDWQSPTDPDSRIARMKDGQTHLAYKAEHAVDLDTEAIVAAEVHPADQGDADTGPQTLAAAEENAAAGGSETPVSELVADKGYHENALLVECAAMGIRTYIPQRSQKSHRWADKPEAFEAAFRANRRRMRGARGRLLSRRRSQLCERTFAHVCETGGGRRAWLRGIAEVTKLHRMRCAAYNLGLLLRKVFGMAKPRCGQAGWRASWELLALLGVWILTIARIQSVQLLSIMMLGAFLVLISARSFREFTEPSVPESRLL